jgi:hypothetical protein
MAVTYGFYNSLDGDRVYNAIQLSRLFSSIIRDGVLGSIGNVFFVAAGSGLHVTVDTGRAWFDYSWTDNDSLLSLDIPTPHATLSRIDAVVLEMDSSNGVRANDIKIISGIAAPTPVAPTMVHAGGVNQYPFAYVLVPPQATQILQGNITSKIGTSLCPLVTGLLQIMTIDAIVAQWEAQFTYWFENLQDQLDENQAANLQNQITDANNTLIEEIISTATPNQFVFDNIPGGFDMLRVSGLLKGTASTGGDAAYPVIRFNDDTGANYAYVNPANGQFTGWGSNTSVNPFPVVNSVSKNANIYTHFVLEMPFYDLAAYKWAINRGSYGAAPTANPGFSDEMLMRNIWRSNTSINKITISGTYVATISRLRLYGCAL